MSFDKAGTTTAIQAEKLSKCYQLYNHPSDRLKQFLWRGKRKYYRELWALRDIDLSVAKGEVVGIVGRNGSGKSTLLQLICGTLTPTHGSIAVSGRIAALLELGAGFNPEFTGRENVVMSATIMGLSQSEITDHLEDIINFSGIRDFIDQPVKTYSSGMYVRLAFSVAINVNPDILVIDEALSVGDGAFAHQSFNRIMQMRDAGKTILFCSHSLFQVESLCARAIWINNGQIILDADSADVVTTYQAFLDKSILNPSLEATQAVKITSENNITAAESGRMQLNARLTSAKVLVNGINHRQTIILSQTSHVSVHIVFASDPNLPCPNVAVTIHAMDGRMLTSAATWEDQFTLHRASDGSSQVCLEFKQLPLLKGEYMISAHLLCHRGLHIYDSANSFATLQIKQNGRLQGYFVIPHRWTNT